LRGIVWPKQRRIKTGNGKGKQKIRENRKRNDDLIAGFEVYYRFQG
jgi:hypothetical protein